MEEEEDHGAFDNSPLFTFVESQLQLLRDAAPDAKKLDNTKDQHHFIKAVRKRVLDLPESKALTREGKEDLKAAINSWFSVRSKRQTNKIKFAKTWTPRLVLYEEQKEIVNDMKGEMYERARRKGDSSRRPFDYF